MKYGQPLLKAFLYCLIILNTCGEVAAAKKDSLQILDRIYEYQEKYDLDINNIQDNVYAKFRFNVEKRNFGAVADTVDVRDGERPERIYQGIV